MQYFLNLYLCWKFISHTILYQRRDVCIVVYTVFDIQTNSNVYRNYNIREKKEEIEFYTLKVLFSCRCWDVILLSTVNSLCQFLLSQKKSIGRWDSFHRDWCGDLRDGTVMEMADGYVWLERHASHTWWNHAQWGCTWSPS